MPSQRHDPVFRPAQGKSKSSKGSNQGKVSTSIPGRYTSHPRKQGQ